MEYEDIISVLSRIKGCTFASLDAVTSPASGLTKTTKRERVILFTNKGGSGYERMVRRRLAKIGLDPSIFKVSDLPWGRRIEGTPILEHKGEYYLQTVLLAEGQSEYTILGRVVDPVGFGLKPRPPQRGLPPELAVRVHSYKVRSITRLAVLGEELHQTIS